MLIELKKVNFKDIIAYPDLEIKAGQVTFLCGESGCGKSTLLKLINGTVSPSEGRILFEGKDMAEMDPVALRREYLLVGQSVYLFDGTIRQNFELFYQYRELAMPDDTELRRCLELCCADFPFDAVCTAMSGGERQRIFLAICLSFQPKVLMLDEPTSALDSVTANQLMENITSYCRDKKLTMIVVSHDVALAERFSDRVIRLRGGLEDA